MNLVMRLNSLVREHGTGLRTLGAVAGVTHDTAGRWLKGESEPRASQLVAIADHFCVGVEYLLGRTDDRKATGPAPLTQDESDGLRLMREVGFVRATSLLTADKLKRDVITTGAVIEVKAPKKQPKSKQGPA